MEKNITDECTGLKYELVGDYYLVAGDDKPEECPIGIWGQRHLRYLKQYRRVVYAELCSFLRYINKNTENSNIQIASIDDGAVSEFRTVLNLSSFAPYVLLHHYGFSFFAKSDT